MSAQLINPRNFNVKNIVFAKCKHRTVPNQNISYQSIRASYRYPNGKIGDFILETPVVYSFGVQANYKDQKTKDEITNYSQSFCLYSNHGPTKEELEFEKMINDIVDACKTELVRQKVKYKGYEIEAGDSELKRIKVLKIPLDENKNPKPDVGPRWYVRLVDKKDDDGEIVIKSLFYDTTGAPIDPIDVGRCRTKSCIKFDSIFLNSAGIYPQFRVQESYVDIIDNTIRPMLSKNCLSEFGSDPIETEGKPQDKDNNTTGQEDDEGGETDTDNESVSSDGGISN